MGLILEGERFAVLSDILGDEDHLGDMDFKVAGTADGVTALQMDIKIAGITEEIMKVALTQAKDGRLHILGEMAKALDRRARRARRACAAHRAPSRSRPTRSAKSSASGGKVIREIVEKTGAKIDIEDDGTVKVASSDRQRRSSAAHQLDQVDRVGAGSRRDLRRHGRRRSMDFGAFVNFFGAKRRPRAYQSSSPPNARQQGRPTSSRKATT